MADHRQALQALYRAPLEKFVAERNRLAAELRAAGDVAAAKQLARRRRPTTSAWTVNQLYWQARGTFDALLAASAQIRKGDLGATRAHRDALRDLHQRAAAILRESGHGATDEILRRVSTTLAALAAAGGFEPDPPGALATDREPPGFDAADMTVLRGSSRPRAVAASAAAAERARRKEQAERHRLQKALRQAQAAVSANERGVSLLKQRLRATEEALEAARQVVRDLERQLAGLQGGCR